MNLNELNDIPPWEWPENAAKLIIETLADQKAPAPDRLLAAEMAGEETILDDHIGNTLLSIIRSKEEPVELRSSAAISLGPGLEEVDLLEYADEDDQPLFSENFAHEIQRTFHKLYQDTSIPDELRRAVLESSVRNPQDWHADAIRSAYQSSNYEWKLTSVFCMEFVRGFEDQILEALDSKDHNILCHAVRAAGNWELDTAWAKIARFVISPDTEKELRIAAIESAASIRPWETEILEPLTDSYDEDISEAAMDALTEAGLGDVWDEEEDEYEDGDNDDEEDDKI